MDSTKENSIHLKSIEQDIQLLKEFILRRQEILNLIKPIVLVLLLDETKKELSEANKDLSDFIVSKKCLIPFGEDNYQQNAIELASVYYESNINETREHIEFLRTTINTLSAKLNFDNDRPTKAEKHAHERRLEIESIFGMIVMKGKVFKIKCFDILKNLIFGELIRTSKPATVEHCSLLNLSNKHLRDLKVGLGQIAKPEYDEEVSILIKDVKRSYIDLGMEHKIKEVFSDEIISIESLLNWYGLRSDTKEVYEQLEAKIKQRINLAEADLNELNITNSFYEGMIANFQMNSDKWAQSWINQKLPNEDLF